jgi:hypothetical protein
VLDGKPFSRLAGCPTQHNDDNPSYNALPTEKHLTVTSYSKNFFALPENL